MAQHTRRLWFLWFIPVFLWHTYPQRGRNTELLLWHLTFRQPAWEGTTDQPCPARRQTDGPSGLAPEKPPLPRPQLIK